MIAIFSILLFSSAGYAKDVIHEMIRAQSRSALVQATVRERDLQRHRRVCEIQLRSRRVPIKCFSAIDVEGADLTDIERERAWLLELCLERVRKSDDFGELSALKAAAQVPEQCRSAAAERISDLRYSDRTANPDRLFRERFRKDER